MAAVCTLNNRNFGVTFVDSLTFTESFPSGMRENFVAASGSGGARSTLTSLSAAGSASVAYLSPACTNTFLAPSSAVVTPAGALQLPVASLTNSLRGTTSRIPVAHHLFRGFLADIDQNRFNFPSSSLLSNVRCVGPAEPNPSSETALDGS